MLYPLARAPQRHCLYIAVTSSLIRGFLLGCMPPAAGARHTKLSALRWCQRRAVYEGLGILFPVPGGFLSFFLLVILLVHHCHGCLTHCCFVAQPCPLFARCSCIILLPQFACSSMFCVDPMCPSVLLLTTVSCTWVHVRFTQNRNTYGHRSGVRL